MQNLAPGAIARLGLSNEIITTNFPHLIAVNIVGYDQGTSYAHMRAYDMLVQAESGICAVTGTPEAPCKIGVSAADIATGMNAHAAILEALLARGKTGCGRIIEVSMFDGMADWMAVPLLHFEHAGRETERYGLAHASIYPYRPYLCSDGAVVVIAIQHNGEWQRFCSTVLRRNDLLIDERFTTNARRVANRRALDAEIEPILAAISRSEAVRRLEEAQIVWGRISTVRDLSDHPALRRMKIALPDGGLVSVPIPAGRNADMTVFLLFHRLVPTQRRIRREFTS